MLQCKVVKEFTGVLEGFTEGCQDVSLDFRDYSRVQEKSTGVSEKFSEGFQGISKSSSFSNLS